MSKRTFQIRRLQCESLESRKLMAGDLCFGHNFAIPEDTDASGLVSPIDALKVINALNLSVAESAELIDVNADGTLSPLDALTVINRLNLLSGGEGAATPSSVPVAARIARIEAALASGEVPSNLTIRQATRIVETLRLGGSPELGDCERSDSDVGAEEKLANLSERLLELGVDSAQVEKVVAAIQAELDAGGTDFKAIVDTVLEENAIDLEALTLAYREQQKVERIATKLEEIGTDQTVIDQLTAALQQDISNGTLLTRQQLTSRLTEFGIDPTTVFENHSHRSHHGGNEVVNVDEVTSRLEKMGVDATIITTIVAEITAAEGSGTPMTRSQLFARLQELGVVKPDNASQLSERTERIGRFAGRRR